MSGVLNEKAHNDGPPSGHEKKLLIITQNSHLMWAEGATRIFSVIGNPSLDADLLNLMEAPIYITV